MSRLRHISTAQVSAFHAFSNCLSETGFCRRMRSRSFSTASTLAVSFFSCAVTTFKSGSLILPFSRPPSQTQVAGLPKVNSQLASEPLGSARTGESHIGEENIKGASWGRQCANLGLGNRKRAVLSVLFLITPSGASPTPSSLHTSRRNPPTSLRSLYGSLYATSAASAAVAPSAASMG